MKKENEFFEDLCRKYTNEIYFYVNSVLKDKNMLETIMQDIFYEVYFNIFELMKLNNASIRTKLYIYARNHIIKRKS